MNPAHASNAQNVKPVDVAAVPVKTATAEEMQACLKTVHFALNDIKAQQITELDIRHLSSFTDVIVIASGTSTRHVKALADNVAEECKKAGFRPLGVEGERDAEWVLIDLGFIVVHVMLPTARTFYDLEGMWRTQK